MRILSYLSITLLCLGTSIVFSDHNEGSNNGGHSEWGHSYNSNTLVGIRYTDKWYKNASDYEWPFSADTSTETTTANVPVTAYSYASWSCEANIRCNSNFYRGYYWVDALIYVDGETKDSDFGPWDYSGGYPEFEGRHNDRAKAYHSESKTLQGQYPHPSNTASDCSTSGSINGYAYDMNWNGALDAYSHIPW
ncbi:hypothetical protein J4G08_04780 [Candidatus Poribacteria bacterium]|nr:hypothetical protein [Candidatus Poribacteria bacterium]